MSKPKETAEQQLLKLIESNQPPVEAAAAKPAKKQVNLFEIKMINKILWVAVMVCGAALFVSLVWGIGLLTKDVSVKADAPLAKESSAQVAQSGSFDQLVETIEKRNIFQPAEAIEEPSAVSATMGGDVIARKVAKFRLVGVSWLDDVESASVMIEDSAVGTTYFLKKGETINDVVVKTIYADGVLLGYQNEEIILNYVQDKSSNEEESSGEKQLQGNQSGGENGIRK